MNTTKIESHKERKKCSSNYQAYVTSTFTTSNLFPVDHPIFRSFPNAPGPGLLEPWRWWWRGSPTQKLQLEFLLIDNPPQRSLSTTPKIFSLNLSKTEETTFDAKILARSRQQQNFRQLFSILKNPEKPVSESCKSRNSGRTRYQQHRDHEFWSLPGFTT